MYIDDSLALYTQLNALGLLKESPPFWWPNYGSFEVVLGVILTQNSNWTRVEASLKNLRLRHLCDLEPVALSKGEWIRECIQPSGMYTHKTTYIQALSQNIIGEFGSFESFCDHVDRNWLLQQRGIGPESADSILCYACGRAVMVVDRYTQRLLSALGYVFEDYDELQAWCSNLHVNFDEAALPKIYAEFHGMIVEYMKRYSSSKGVNIVF